MKSYLEGLAELVAGVGVDVLDLLEHQFFSDFPVVQVAVASSEIHFLFEESPFLVGIVAFDIWCCFVVLVQASVGID